ncbi:MAG: hypothetical protein EXX96DRAFT_541991 [Benjaminiella poitrasii]|nr:MAG: hypothetical protein EXX96DRAFT_541991 [Benjaminiella poitrasii]
MLKSLTSTVYKLEKDVYKQLEELLSFSLILKDICQIFAITYLKDYLYEAKKRCGKRKEIAKFKQEHEEFITQFLYEDCTKTIGMLRDKLNNRFPDLAARNISVSGIWRFIVDKIGFTSKRTKPIEMKRNDETHLEARQEFILNDMSQ